MALVGALIQGKDDEPLDAAPRGNRDSGRPENERRPAIPDAIQRLIPINRKGQEPCLLNGVSLPCSGGSRERCGNARRAHDWPERLLSRLLEWGAVRMTGRHPHGLSRRLSSLLEQWPEIVISPFGVVDKRGEDAATSGRTIHDLSFPEDASNNDCTDQNSIAKPDNTQCDAVASEMLRLKREHPETRICVMAGDVASAFRNISIHSNSVYRFAGQIEEDDAIVIELVAPFDWTGSPGFYEIHGWAIAHAHGSHINGVSSAVFFPPIITGLTITSMWPLTFARHAMTWAGLYGT
ncbi:hypothetical protein BBJ28_00003085 [Nothophytophthora sp. Chile5]|nr:hypothetical protein BBJ28_00003085 [Nothophytophthora sp. Chile5]